MKEYERQKDSDVKELNEIAAAENKKKLEQFIKIEKNIKSGSSSKNSETVFND
jgi:hypothetical protein